MCVARFDSTALRVIDRTVEADWDHSTARAAHTAAAADMAVDWDCNSAAAADMAVDWDCNSAAAADTAVDWDCNSAAAANTAVEDCSSAAAADMAADLEWSWDPGSGFR